MDVNSTAGAPGFDNAPAHYKTEAGIQSFDVIDAYNMGFYTGNAWKYLTRWDKKGSPENDLDKAEHYLIEASLRASREVSVLHTVPDDMRPAVVLTAFGFQGTLYDAGLDLLLSHTSYNPRTYLEVAIVEVRQFRSYR